MARSFWAGWLFLVPFTLLAQDTSLPVPPNVAVDGVPAIPMKLVRRWRLTASSVVLSSSPGIRPSGG